MVVRSGILKIIWHMGYSLWSSRHAEIGPQPGTPCLCAISAYNRRSSPVQADSLAWLGCLPLPESERVQSSALRQTFCVSCTLLDHTIIDS